MLTKFSVSNFKNFERKLILDLSANKGYDFNIDAVNSGYVSKGIVYGGNASGKSNLCLAVFDITQHFTDKSLIKDKYEPYLCLDSKSKSARFEYGFRFDGDELSYVYSKDADTRLLSEKLVINGEPVLYYDYVANKGYSALKGTNDVALVTNVAKDSMVKHIADTALLDKSDRACSVFLKFMDFVDSMALCCRSGGNAKEEFRKQTDDALKVIAGQGRTKDYEKFLNDCGIHCILSDSDVTGENTIVWNFPGKNRTYPFSEIASSGTKSLAVFYALYIFMNKASFVLMDGINSFCHFSVAKKIVRMLKELKDVQILMTADSTDLLSNDILRPDCYFVLHDGRCDSFDNLTDMDIQYAHNLQRMYKAGLFSD